jgi:drug/metabolite transporter (DMT)-like permease
LDVQGAIMDTPLIGETAALFAAVLWTVNAILFSAAGKRIGSVGVNAFRILVAVGFLAATHIIILGTLIPTANSAQWLWLGVSGIVGLGIGDFALFAAYVIIGPKRSLLLMALAPVSSVLAGYFVLNETLGPLALLGIAITLVGIIIVVLEKKEDKDDFKIQEGKKTYGFVLGVIAAIGQGVGLVISKYGMVTVADDPKVPLDSLSATLIRMIIGAIFIWICITVVGRLPRTINSLKDKQALKLTSAGAFVGPFLGVWLSMVAITFTEAGIAMTLMSLMPVVVIPAVWLTHGEKTTRQGIAGALIAVVGVAIIFLV